MESWRKLHNSFIEVRNWKRKARYLFEASFSAEVRGARYKKIISEAIAAVRIPSPTNYFRDILAKVLDTVLRETCCIMILWLRL